MLFKYVKSRLRRRSFLNKWNNRNPNNKVLPINIFDEKIANYRVHSSGVSRRKNFFKTKRPVLIHNILMKALGYKHIDKGKILKKYILLIYSLIRSGNIEALLYIFRLKNK